MISHLGAMLPVADGLALAAQLRGERRVAATFSGDGGDERGRLPRSGEPGRGLEAARALRHREQPVRPLHPGRRAVRLRRPRRPRHRLRDPRRGRGRQRRAGGGGGGGPGRRARPRAATGRRCSSSRPSACAATRRPRAPPTCPRSCSRSGRRKDPVARFEQWLSARGLLDDADARQAARRAQARDRRPRGRGAGRARSGRPAPSASWPTSTRPARCAWRRPDPSAPHPELRYVDAIQDGLREAMRRRPRGDPDRPGHRGVRRRLQGDGGLRRRSSARRACATRRSSSRARWAPPSASPSTASGRWSRCSSATSSPAASTRSSTTWPRRTTAGARAVPVVVRVPDRRRHRGGAVPLAERGGLVHARRRPQGGRAGHALRREGAADRGLRGRQPRALPRAQAPLPLRPRARPRRLVHDASRPGADRARRHGRHHRDLLASACPGPSTPPSAWPRRDGRSR